MIWVQHCVCVALVWLNLVLQWLTLYGYRNEGFLNVITVHWNIHFQILQFQTVCIALFPIHKVPKQIYREWCLELPTEPVKSVSGKPKAKRIWFKTLYHITNTPKKCVQSAKWLSGLSHKTGLSHKIFVVYHKKANTIDFIFIFHLLVIIKLSRLHADSQQF